jgi:nucleotide-binding universal stress UspA family protein
VSTAAALAPARTPQGVAAAAGYAQVLVHMDASPTAARRLAYAVALAGGCNAALTALYAVPPAFMELPFAPVAGPGVAAVMQQLDDEQRLAARAQFERAQDKGVARWAEVRDPPVLATFVQQALFADLLVMSMPDAAAPGRASGSPDFALATLLDSGRPTVLLPTAWQAAMPPRIVMLAWKPCRQAMCAVMGALPLLTSAQEVHVVGWPGDQLKAEGAMLDLSVFLARHGVRAQWHLHGLEPHDVGQALLAKAAELKADLLVMGCYGHSRVRERLLGGTTRTVLNGMTLPVLMAN